MNNKIKFKLILIIFLSISYNLQSQNTFKTVLRGYQSLGATITVLDSTYLFADFGWKTILREFDNNGMIKYSHCFSSFPGAAAGGIGSKCNIIPESGNLILLLMGSSRCLASFNMQTNSFNWLTGFNINAIPIYPFVLNKGLNKNYIISTHQLISQPNSQWYPLVVITDSTGQLKNSFQIENHFGNSIFTHQVSNNSYITGINYRDTLGCVLVKYDTSGTVLWAKSFFQSGGYFHSAVNNNDGTLTIIGCPDSNFNGFYMQKLFLMKVDTSGNLLWCKQYGDSNHGFRYGMNSQVKQTNDGGYVITGYICDTSVWFMPGCDLVIIKTDANGDTLWTRTHGNAYTQDGGQDIAQTPDGGYIMTGYSSSDQFYPFHPDGCYIIFKTDSLGMTSTHCQEFNTPFAVSNIPANDSTITLSITTGLISAISSSVYDTTDVVQQKNGCWLSAVGMEQQPNKSIQGYKAIPNPNQGIFTLKNNVVNPEAVTIIVYDILGKEVINLQLINNPELELNLTSRPAGIYFVKIIQGNKVEVVKVVVE